MLLIFMGPSCVGKSTVAECFKKDRGMEIYTGKDYLRFAKNENEAWNKFNEKLLEASNNKELSSESIIYIITEKNIIPKLQSLENTIFVKFIADIDIIKERFAKRMNGNLPKPLEKMLETQLGDWKDINSALCVDTTNMESEEIVMEITKIAEVK